MNKESLIAIVVASLVFVSGIALAGTAPSPFKPEINKLGAIENSLNSIDKRIKAVLATPPDPVGPNGHQKINAMDHQLQLLNGFMVSTMDEIIDAVLATPPDPVMPVINALEDIRYVMSNDSSEGGIADAVDAYLNEYFPAGVCIQPELMEFYNALIQFSGDANTIIMNVDDYIDQITGGPAASVDRPFRRVGSVPGPRVPDAEALGRRRYERHQALGVLG